MAREQRLTAILRITKSKNDPGMRGTLRRLFKSHFEHRGMDTPPTVQIDHKNACLNVYGNVTEEELEEFSKKVEIPFKIEDFARRPTGTPEKKDKKVSNGLHAQNISLQNKVAKLQGELNSINSKYKDLQSEHDRLDAEVTGVLETNIRLEEQAAKLTEEVAKKSVAVSDLSNEKVELEKKLAKLEEYARFPKNFHGAAIAALSEFAEKLGQFDSITGEAVYDTAPDSSIEELLEKINSVGLPEKAGSAGDVFDMVKRYITDKDAEKNLGRAFDALDEEKSEKYNKAVKELETLEAQKEKINSELPEDVIKEMEKILDKRAADEKKLIAEYEESRKTFVSSIQNVLSEVSDSISRKKEFSNLRGEVQRNIGESELPVYICLREDGKYSIRVYFPVKQEQKSKTYDIILCENILSEKVASLIKKDDFDKIEEQFDEESGLLFYEINLPKSRYSYEDVRKIKTALEESVREGYDKTALRKLGVGLNVMFNDRFGIATEVIQKAMAPKTSSKREKAAERREAIKDILSKKPRGAERDDIENALRFRGFRFTTAMVHYDLKQLRASHEIDMIEKGRERQYILAKPLEEKELDASTQETPKKQVKEPVDLAEKYGVHKTEEAYEMLQKIETIVNEAGAPIKIADISTTLVQEGEYVNREKLKAHLKSLKEHGIIEQIGVKAGAKYIPAQEKTETEETQTEFSSIEEAIKAGYITTSMVAEGLGVTPGRVAQLLTHPRYRKKELKSEKIMVGGQERRLVEKESFDKYKEKLEKGGD